MNGLTAALVLVGVTLGTFAALGSVNGADTLTWVSVASVATAILTLGLLRALELGIPPPRPTAPGLPRLIERMRSAETGDPLARQYILECLDQLEAASSARPGAVRYAAQRELYRLSQPEFHRFLDRTLRAREQLS